MLNVIAVLKEYWKSLFWGFNGKVWRVLIKFSNYNIDYARAIARDYTENVDKCPRDWNQNESGKIVNHIYTFLHFMGKIR